MLTPAAPPASPTPALTAAQAELVRKAHALAGAGTAPTIDALAEATGTDRANVAKMRRRAKAKGLWPFPDFPRGWLSPNAKPRLNAAPKRPRVRAPKVKAPAPPAGVAARAKDPGARRPRPLRLFGLRIEARHVGSLDEYRRVAGHLIHGPGYRP